jgi:UDP-glucose 4-epimerase
MSGGAARRVLVTGAGGFIGANLARSLVRHGHEVFALMRPGGSRWRLDDMVDDLRLSEVELADEDAVDEAVQRARPEWIFHLAAHGGYSWQQGFRQIVDANLVATSHLLAAVARGGCDAFVSAGSSSEYGYKDHPASENEVLEPNSAYAVTKAAATALCRHVARESGFPVSTLRLYSVYGPWEEPGRLIPTLITYGLRGELPPLVSSATARDFIHVTEVCEAFLKTARAGVPPGSVYNIGSGRQTTMREIVEIATRVLSIDVEPSWEATQARRWDTDTWVANISAARRELDWEPRRSLEHGFAATVDWLRDEPGVWDRYGVDARR